jgi:hypothetical protein
VIVVFLWWTGHRVAAVAVGVAATVITVTAALAPPVRRRLEQVTWAIGRGVGSVLTVVLLAVVQALVFAPAALVARLVRVDPLDPLAGRDVSSRWADRRGTRSLPERPFGDERYRARAAAVATGGAAPVGTPRWIRGLVGGIAIALVADVALGSSLVWLDRVVLEGDDATALDGPVFGFDPAAQEALATQDRGEELMRELDQVGIGRPDPFIGWRFGPGVTHTSELVNVVDGVRATAAPPGDAGDERGDGLRSVEAWFFGGSTMYGSGQRDTATIPSVLVEQLAADGIALHATNLGHPAYADWQQVQLLEAELTAGTRPPPELVVFYDGFNDLTLQTQFGVHDEPTHLFFDPIRGQPTTAGATGDDQDASVAATVRSWWADHSAVALGIGRVVDLFDDEPTIRLADVEAPPIESIDPVAAADAAVAIHRRGVDHVIALARAYDFTPVFFWQPFLYTRDPLTPAEETLVGLPGYDTDVWLPMTDEARARLSPPVIDLSDALDGEPTSVFWDFVHTNERGAALVAEAMRPHLLDALARP